MCLMVNSVSVSISFRKLQCKMTHVKISHDARVVLAGQHGVRLTRSPGPPHLA
jgi:hypothetical protein